MTENILIGLVVEIEDRGCQKCRGNLAVIHDGKGPHAAELQCLACDSHRGWVSKRTAEQITAVIEKFGTPTEPLIFRRQTTLHSPNGAGCTAFPQAAPTSEQKT